MIKSLFALVLLITFMYIPTSSADYVVRGQVGKNEKLIPYTDEQLDEALQVSDECSAYNYTKTHYDCDCVGITFLKLRQKKGDKEDTFSLREEAQKKCPNGPNMAGDMYDQCMGWAKYTRPSDYKAFCRCYSSAFANRFVKNPSENLDVIEAHMVTAMTSCHVNAENERVQDRAAFIKKLKENGTYDRLFPGALPDK